jgi:hypothetical protein
MAEPQNEQDPLADFIGKYHLDAPRNIKPLLKTQDEVFKTLELADTAMTTSLSCSSSDDQYLRVRHDGSFLTSTSFNSQDVNEVNYNPTAMLRRFNLKAEEENSSTSTEKVTNHGSRFESTSRYKSSPGRAYSYIDSFANTPSFRGKLRYRLGQVATSSPIRTLDQFRPISTPPSVLSGQVSHVKKEEESDSNQSEAINDLSDNTEETSYLTGFASLHIGAPLADDADSKEESASFQLKLIEEDAQSKESDDNSLKPSHLQPEKVTHQSDEEHSATRSKQSNGSYDESEFNQMTNITHSYQKHSDVNTKSAKMSAIPMSGIGVDLSKDYSDGPTVLTPREAGPCTLSSFVEGLFGIGSGKKKGSALEFVVRDLFSLCQ